MVEPSPISKQVGVVIREHRSKRGWTIQELADAANCDYSYLSGIELGKRNPSLDKVAGIATALGMTTWGLIRLGEKGKDNE